MMRERISIYARLKPSAGNDCPYVETIPAASFDAALWNHQDNEQLLRISMPMEGASRTADLQWEGGRKQLHFRFDTVFHAGAQQEEVFSVVARPLLDRTLEGYNGTLLAYGQSGSGKTYTISGGDGEELAGIIPRSMAYIFQKVEERERSVAISYFEIYEENGRDLLGVDDDRSKMVLLEDADGSVHIRNLTCHTVASEEQAKELLRMGQNKRARAETAFNQTSTRSHCILTIIIRSSTHTSDGLVSTSKLHIVDLAGSERVYKNGLGGQRLAEAKYINLSLHHLQQVIKALGEEKRKHIPYRNSLLTLILKDSLGGNCMTSMIATCAVEEANMHETISTCRFAQRAAMIKNEAVRNETLDPLLEIRLLRTQLRDVKRSYHLLSESVNRGYAWKQVLSPQDITACEKAVNDYVQQSAEKELNLPYVDWRIIQLCFRLLKETSAPPSGWPCQCQCQVVQMGNTLAQRDRELAILCKLLHQEKTRMDQLVGITSVHQPPQEGPIAQGGKNGEGDRLLKRRAAEVASSAPSDYAESEPPLSEELSGALSNLPNLNEEARRDLRRRLLQTFLTSHPKRPELDRMKEHLMARLDEARILGDGIRSCRSQEARRKEEQVMLMQLRRLKSQADHTQSRMKDTSGIIQNEFDQWSSKISNGLL